MMLQNSYTYMHTLTKTTAMCIVPHGACLDIDRLACEEVHAGQQVWIKRLRLG